MNIKFKLFQEVSIHPLSEKGSRPIKGRVVAIFIGEFGLQFKVRYFQNAKAEEVYFFEDELEA